MTKNASIDQAWAARFADLMVSPTAGTAGELFYARMKPMATPV